MIICRFEVGLTIAKLLQVQFFWSVSICRMINVCNQRRVFSMSVRPLLLLVPEYEGIALSQKAVIYI
jgi:hypothetical protein